MAHLLRGKQAGIQNDLSAGLNSDLFAVDDLARYGINSQISCLAYDPVQSLLAVGTKSSQFGPGQIYLFGRGRIQAVLPTPARGASIKQIQFCAEKVVALDSKHDVSIYSIELKRLITTYSPPGGVTTLCTDPMLDYALLGMQSGEILAFDMDREAPAPFKIPNLWQEINPKARISTIVSLQFHPRDIGTLLVGYTEGAAIYSFKLNKALRFFQYEVPRGAPGGDGDPAASNVIRRPKLVHAVWHPTGTFVMTGHDDSSIVFWDTVKDGRIVMARTLTDTGVATPGTVTGNSGMRPGTMAVKEPLFLMKWCAHQQDPEDTMILIAGGQSTQAPTKGLTLFEMGRTPVYATSTWDTLGQYFDSPKRQRILPTPIGAEVVNYCLIPRSSPHFDGAHDPIAIIALLSSGELLTLSFPSGMPISPTNQLHISLSLVHPFVKMLKTSQVEREKWLGLQERRQQGPLILQGGSEIPSPLRRYETRSITQSIHADGTIRLWDPGYGDEIENEKVLQVDVARAIGRWDEIDITETSFAGNSAELTVGMRSGEVMIFRWGTNRNHGREPPQARPNTPGALTTITDRVDPSLSEGLVPLTLLDQKDGAVTAVCNSEIGFVAAGFEGGSIVLIDLRGPAIIMNTSVQNLAKNHKTGSLRRRGSSNAGSKPEWATSLEFSIMTLDSDSYSSICLHIGTNLGNVATFKIIPDPSGRYTTDFAGHLQVDSSKIMYMSPINADTGKAASASQTAMGGLRNGLKVNAALLVVTPTAIHIFRPATSKGSHKGFDNYFCDSAAMIHFQDRGHALLGLFGDGKARAYAIPSLRELASIDLTNISNQNTGLDVRQLFKATISPTGTILAFTGPSELALLNVFGTGEPLTRRQDRLFDLNRLIPPRPTISNMQWVTGTQYITPADMDILIGGPERPPSKRMIAQAKAEEEQRRKAGRSSGSSSAAANMAQSDEGYWAYMQRQLAERTEKLGLVGDSMDNLERNSANWLDDVNKFVGRQKRNAAGGIIKARFGL